MRLLIRPSKCGKNGNVPYESPLFLPPAAFSQSYQSLPETARRGKGKGAPAAPDRLLYQYLLADTGVSYQQLEVMIPLFELAAWTIWPPPIYIAT